MRITTSFPRVRTRNTELSESQASDQTVMAIAGHVSPKMLAHYSQVRMNAKRKALSGAGSGDSYDTKHDTNRLPAATANPQVIEINGRPVGMRRRAREDREAVTREKRSANRGSEWIWKNGLSLAPSL